MDLIIDAGMASKLEQMGVAQAVVEQAKLRDRPINWIVQQGVWDESLCRLQHHPRIVHLTFSFQQLADIDLIGQTFTTQARVTMMWKPTQVELDHWTSDPGSFDPDIPGLDITNAQEQECAPFFKPCIETNAGKHFVRCKMLYTLTLMQQMDVKSFPFDCQFLRVKIEAASAIATDIFVPSVGGEIGTLELSNFRLQEWDIGQMLIEFGAITYSNGNSYSICDVVFTVQRKWRHYVRSLFLELAIIAATSLSVFVLDADSYSDRIGILLSLLLTTVAFELVSSSMKPGVPYATKLDEYVTLAFIFIFLVGITCTILATVDLGDSADDVERYSAVGCGTLFAIVNIVFAYQCWTARTVELEKLSANRAERLAISKSRNVYACGELVVEHNLLDAAKGHYYGRVDGGDNAALATPMPSNHEPTTSTFE